MKNRIYRKCEMLGRLRKSFFGRENIKTAKKNSSYVSKIYETMYKLKKRITKIKK